MQGLIHTNGNSSSQPNHINQTVTAADLGGEWKLGGLCFTGSVDGCQRRGPRLSHFLNLKKKREKREKTQKKKKNTKISFKV